MSALQGIRVLDLSRVLAGPWATQLLADLGADVVKVERPVLGDDTRAWGPPYAVGPQGKRESAYFLSANRGKRSICVDFSRPEGRDIVRDLAARADVLVENYKVGGLGAYGLDYSSIRPVNPRIVYCSISGFGQSGPYAHRPGYDFLIQAMSGLMSVTGEPNGEPMKVGVALADVITGLYACNGILAALRARESTGAGQHIDVALLDSMIAALANQALNHLVSGDDCKRFGNGHPNIAPYDIFPTATHSIVITVGNNSQFARMCLALGAEHVASDERYQSNEWRVANRRDLRAALWEVLARQPAEVWLGKLEKVGVPAGPVNSVAEAFQESQVRHRELRLTLDREDLGPTPGVACPIRLSDTPVTYERAAPALGASTREILMELGRSASQMNDLEKGGVIFG